MTVPGSLRVAERRNEFREVGGLDVLCNLLPIRGAQLDAEAPISALWSDDRLLAQDLVAVVDIPFDLSRLDNVGQGPGTITCLGFDQSPGEQSSAILRVFRLSPFLHPPGVIKIAICEIGVLHLGQSELVPELVEIAGLLSASVHLCVERRFGIGVDFVDLVALCDYAIVFDVLAVRQNLGALVRNLFSLLVFPTLPDLLTLGKPVHESAQTDCQAHAAMSF